MKFLKLVVFVVVLLFPLDVMAESFEEEFNGKEFKPVIESHYKVEYTNWNRFWLSAAIVTAASDIYSTQKALNDNPNAYETNPLYGSNPSVGKMIAIKVVGFGLIYYMIEYWTPEENKQTFRNFGWGFMTFIQGFATFHNLNVAE